MTLSLQRNLNRRILSATALFAVLAGVVSGWIAFGEARELQDTVLRQVATLAATRSNSAGFLNADADPEDTVVLQRLGAGSTPGIALPSTLDDGMHTLTINGTGWRVFVYTKTAHDDPDRQRLAVSQRTEARDEIAWNSSLHTLLPILLLAPLLMALVSFAVEKSMQPLNKLAATVDHRDDLDLETLSDSDVPAEVRPFTGSINRLLLRLRKTLSQQRRFVADAAHELRTPVTGLSLLAERLAKAERIEEVRTQLPPLRQGLERMQLLVGQLLDLARLNEANREVANRVALQPIVQDVIAELYPLAERKAQDLGMNRNQALFVMGTPHDLHTLFRNAVDNAIRYTPRGGRIDIALYQDGADAVLEIADTGDGIPENELPNVFEPFYRVGVSQEPGTGLGLAISREIATRLGGRLTLANRPGGGLDYCYRQACVASPSQRVG